MKRKATRIDGTWLINRYFLSAASNGIPNMPQYFDRISRNESQRIVCGLLTVSLALILSGGCAAPYSWRQEIPEIDNAPEATTTHDESTSFSGQSQQSTRENDQAQSTSAGSTPETRSNISPESMADLEAIGQVDPKEKENLLADYDKMKPAIWAGLVKQRRALLAYKQQSGDRSNPTSNPTSITEEPRHFPEQKELASASHPNDSNARRLQDSATRNDADLNPQSNIPPRSVTTTSQLAVPDRETFPAQDLPNDSTSQTVVASTAQEIQRPVRQAPHLRPATPSQDQYDTPEAREEMKRQFAQMQMNQQMQLSANPLRSNGFPSSMPQTMGMPSQLPGMGSQFANMQFPSSNMIPQVPTPQSLARNLQASRMSKPQASDPNPGNHLDAAIKALEKEIDNLPDSSEKANRHGALRLLYLAANRPNDAMQPMSGVSSEDQDYWAPQIFGLSTFLDTGQISDDKRRAATAKRHLTKAVKKLGELGTLTVNNLALCRKVTSFGVYDSFEPLEFAPGAEVLLYAEVDNYLSEPHDKGYHTSLKSSYLILDNRGEEVAESEFPVVNDYCRQVRRDFFVRYFVRLPKNLPDGKYTLQLFVEDIKSQKLGQASVELTIRESTGK